MLQKIEHKNSIQSGKTKESYYYAFMDTMSGEDDDSRTSGVLLKTNTECSMYGTKADCFKNKHAL